MTCGKHTPNNIQWMWTIHSCWYFGLTCIHFVLYFTITIKLYNRETCKHSVHKVNPITYACQWMYIVSIICFKLAQLKSPYCYNKYTIIKSNNPYKILAHSHRVLSKQIECNLWSIQILDSMLTTPCCRFFWSGEFRRGLSAV